LAIQSEAVNKGDRVVIVDDIIASGSSALAAIKLIERAGGRCAGIVCLAAFPNWGIKLLSDRGVWFTRSHVGEAFGAERRCPASLVPSPMDRVDAVVPPTLLFVESEHPAP
jgi:hypothetical protein